MKTLSQGEMNLVYPQTNDNWANEVGTTFFADEDDLNEDPRGWLDPWCRPLNKDSMPKEGVSTNDTWEYRETLVHLWYKPVDSGVPIQLFIYRKKQI